MAEVPVPFDEDWRTYPRYECVGLAEIDVVNGPSCLEGVLLDISMDGCLLAMQKPSALPEECLIEMNCEVNAMRFRVVGRVKAARSVCRVGVHFLEVTTQVRRQIEELTVVLKTAQHDYEVKRQKIQKAREAIAMASQPAAETWNNENRRRSKRFLCSGTGEILISPELPSIPGGIADLSKEGCRIVVAKPHKMKREDPVEMMFKVNNLPFRVRATIKSVRNSGTQVGWRFATLARGSRANWTT